MSSPCPSTPIHLFFFFFFFFFFFPHLIYSHHCPSPPLSSKSKSTEPIPLALVPATFAPARSAQDASAVAQIRDTLALYPFCIDSKNFGALDLVFTADAVANYSAPIFVVSSLPAIQSTIKTVLALVDTQHSYGTQAIEILPGGCDARALTYLTATHFGRGKYVGQILVAYGQYQDRLVRVEGGQWRIQERNLVYMGPLIGNTSIFIPG